MIRKTLITTAVVLLGGFGAVHAYAQGGFHSNNASQSGGFQGSNSARSITTVAQAKAARDDSRILMRGYITQHIDDDDYLFKDNTGIIRVEIDDDEWNGQSVTPETLVEIWGEVDRDDHSVGIDVESIRIVQK